MSRDTIFFTTFFTIVDMSMTYDWCIIKVVLMVDASESHVSITTGHVSRCEKYYVPSIALLIFLTWICMIYY